MFSAAAVVAALALTACGGTDDSGSAAAEAQLPAVPDVVAVDPAADLATNLLPDLVVDDLNNDNKVNLRNYGTGDLPILVWLWAPH